MTHICTVATLCFPEKTFPRNYYYCVQDENSLCLCFKNMYRTLFVAIFTSTFIFSMYDHIGLPGCVFPYLSKYKYQQSGWQNLFGRQNIYLCDADYDDINDLSKCLDKIRTLASAICLMLLVWSSKCLSMWRRQCRGWFVNIF